MSLRNECNWERRALAHSGIRVTGGGRRRIGGAAVPVAAVSETFSITIVYFRLVVKAHRGEIVCKDGGKNCLPTLMRSQKGKLEIYHNSLLGFDGGLYCTFVTLGTSSPVNAYIAKPVLCKTCKSPQCTPRW
jgi:hypothetical protein